MSDITLSDKHAGIISNLLRSDDSHRDHPRAPVGRCLRFILLICTSAINGNTQPYEATTYHIKLRKSKSCTFVVAAFIEIRKFGK